MELSVHLGPAIASNTAESPLFGLSVFLAILVTYCPWALDTARDRCRAIVGSPRIVID